MTGEGIEGKARQKSAISEEELALAKQRIAKRAQMTEEELQAEHEERYGKKDPREFLVTEQFFVDDVVMLNERTSIAPAGEQIIGGPIHSYGAGYTQVTMIHVMPTTERPTSTLQFNGISTVRRGDIILAVIPKCDYVNPLGIPGQEGYKPRDFKEEEQTIEVNILNDAQVTIRKERAVDYDSFNSHQT